MFSIEYNCLFWETQTNVEPCKKFKKIQIQIKKSRRDKNKKNKKVSRGWPDSHPNLFVFTFKFFIFKKNKFAPSSSKVKHLFCQNIFTTREEYKFIKKYFVF